MKIPLIFSVNIFGLRSRTFLCFLSRVMNFPRKCSYRNKKTADPSFFAFQQPLFIWGLITHKVENIMTDAVQLKQIQTFCCCKIIPRPTKSRHPTFSLSPPHNFHNYEIVEAFCPPLNRTPTTFIITVACSAYDSRRLYPPTMIINISRQVKDWKRGKLRGKNSGRENYVPSLIAYCSLPHHRII